MNTLTVITYTYTAIVENYSAIAQKLSQQEKINKYMKRKFSFYSHYLMCVVSVVSTQMIRLITGPFIFKSMNETFNTD